MYFIIKRILNSVDSIKFILVKLKKTSKIPLLSLVETNVLKEIILCLEPFAKVTKELEGDKYVTILLILLNVCILFEQLGEIKGVGHTEAGKSPLTRFVERAEF